MRVFVKGRREIFCARYGKIAGCAENSSKEKERILPSALLQTLAVVSLPVIASARAVSVVRQRASFFRPITIPPKKCNVPDDGTCNLRVAATFLQENLLQAALRYLSNNFYRSRNSRIPLILPYGKTRADGNLFNNIPCCPIANISVNLVFAARRCLVCSAKKCFRTQKRRQKRSALR